MTFIDPRNPAASLAASVKLTPEIKRAIIVVLPNSAGTKPDYRMLLIDDSEKAFPSGESRALPLIGVETAIHESGVHRHLNHPSQSISTKIVKHQVNKK